MWINIIIIFFNLNPFNGSSREKYLATQLFLKLMVVQSPYASLKGMDECQNDFTPQLQYGRRIYMFSSFIFHAGI